MSEIPIAALTLDPLMQGRAKMDNEQIESYAEAMRDGVHFPAINVVHVEEFDVYYVTDGWHRIKAAQKAGLEKIAAVVKAGSYHEAFVAALSANRVHGIPRRNADKVRVVQLALTDAELSKMSDRGLAALLGVSQPLVSKTRKLLKVGDNGYQAIAFEAIKISSANLGGLVKMRYFGGDCWMATNDALGCQRQGLIAFSGPNSYTITRRGREYVNWLLANTTDESLRFDLELAEFAGRSNDRSYSWGRGWDELCKLQRAQRWVSYRSLGVLNVVINRGFAFMEADGNKHWVAISPAGSAAIGQPPLAISPRDKKSEESAPQPRTHAEREHDARESYERNLKWVTDRAQDHVKDLIAGYWAKQFFEFYPDLKPVFARTSRELLAAINAATPIPFVPEKTD